MTPHPERLSVALADRYRIERELGQGGMATVYLAQDLRHKRHVAIKVLRPDLAAALGPERFLREIETTANLRHPNILPLYDSGEADGFLFYVMPFIEGESLRDRLTRDRQLPVDVALQIAREAAEALGYAHARGVIHRDIKPENIMLESGHAIVADFGIAKAVSTLDSGGLTQTGLAVGTPAYMSPEQVLAESTLDGRSDLYSLGCVLYEMLTGEPPFAAATTQRTIARRLTEPPPVLTATRPEMGPHLSGALQRVLATEPAGRPATAAHFIESLPTPASRSDPSQQAWRTSGVTSTALLGDLAGAAEQARWCRAAGPQVPYTWQLDSLVASLGGDHARGRAALSPVNTTPLDFHLTFHLAESYAMAGETDRALAVLEESVDKGFYAYAFMNEYCPFMAPLRGNPSFARIMDKARGRWEAFGRAVVR